MDAETPKPPRKRMSQGFKLIVVCILAALMGIPALLVYALLMERTHRAEQVTQEIGGLMGGPQTFLGPVIRIPYTVPRANASSGDTQGALIVFPLTGKAEVQTHSEVRSRSLFRVPVYTSDIRFTAQFDLSGVATEAPPNATLHWAQAEFLTGASDSRGARQDVTARIVDRDVALAPAKIGTQGFVDIGDLDLFATPLSELGPQSQIKASVAMHFTGAQSITLMAFAKSTETQIGGDWNAPSFGGGFLPVNRSVAGDDPARKSGFVATWSVPYVARGLPAVVDQLQFAQLGRSAVSVNFVELTNPYQSVGRSLKYALLFVGLVFLTYFVFESLGGRELHPAQYVLVGLAQITFYLLLLSFAERIGFDAAFLVAAIATVGLISGYAGLIFRSRARFLAALGVFGVLYALIYVLMRLEDYALLVGAVAAFLTIGAVMYLTRDVNWFGKEEPEVEP